MALTYQEFSQNLSSELRPLYSPEESQALIEWLMEHHLGLRRVDVFHFMEEKDIPDSLWKDFQKLKAGEPIQYILGHGPFYGREFLVNPHTLIPRNETEELVHLILKENPQPGLRILDIGTGTGCIPITLKLELKSPEVFALDVSEEAIEVAKQNAQKLQADVDFILLNILTDTPNLCELDILVSNPPYVPEQEKESMHRNVLDHEPHLALFVPNQDPLIFYRTIAQKGKKLLKTSGKIYFEIFEHKGSEVCELLQTMGYGQIKLHQDLNGKNRMVSAINE